MIRSLGIGWIVTFFMFLGFTGGAYYLYDTTRAHSAQRQFEECMSRVNSRDGNWQARSQMALCSDLYLQNGVASTMGRYGPSSNATISLAMVRRPDFRRR